MDVDMRDSDRMTTAELRKNLLHEGFAINREIDGQRRATATFGVHATVTAGSMRLANMDSWPKPLVKATIDFERRMLALVDAAQPLKADAGLKLDQNLQLAEQPHRAPNVKVTHNPKLGL